MPSYVQQVESLPGAVLNRDFSKILGAFSLPVGLYFGNRLVTCDRPESLLSVALQFGNAFRSTGMVSVDVHTLEHIRGSNGGHHSILMHQIYRDAHRAEVDFGRARYFFKVVNGTPQIGLFECLRLPMAHELSKTPMFRAA